MNWFESCLLNGQQTVKRINDVKGPGKYRRPRCPSRNCTRINLVSDLNFDGLIISYADDTCLLFTDESRKGVHYKWTVGVYKVHRCLCDRNLTLSDGITMLMTFYIYNILLKLNTIIIHRWKYLESLKLMYNYQRTNKNTIFRYHSGWRFTMTSP